MWRPERLAGAGRDESIVVCCRANRNTELHRGLPILAGVSQSFGERLRALRSRRHLTPSALAQTVGVTEGAIRQMESGQTKSASFLVGLRLADALGVSPWFLATGRQDDTARARGAGESVVAALAALTLQMNAVDRRVRLLEAAAAPKRRKAHE
ncbi:MAG: helix-turn-helix transcriptional regulator [Candidatus Eremiobacteraeota bacterium]|nr:helix-turn-helix transcriptional regulator [Candidatus Eremiobacteraeota bacterium]